MAYDLKSFRRSGFICHPCPHSHFLNSMCWNCTFCKDGLKSLYDACKACPAGKWDYIEIQYVYYVLVSGLQGGQRQHLHFSVILRTRVLILPRRSNPGPPNLQSKALPTKLNLPLLKEKKTLSCTVLEAVLTSRQPREKLLQQCLYENLTSNNFP